MRTSMRTSYPVNKLSVDELARRMILLAVYWPEYKQALIEDRLRREARARAHGVSAFSFDTWLASRKPPGVEPPFRNRPMKMKRGKPKKRGHRIFYEEW